MASIEQAQDAQAEALRPVALTLADIPAALRLSGEAGWNQTAEDWAVFIERGRVFGLAAPDAAPVATAAILPYGGLAWISMVLVTARWRHRGLARRLMETCIDALRRDGLTPVLDATPAGAEVYRPLGFAPLSGLQRWEGAGRPGPGAAGMPIRPMAASDLERVAALDGAAFGADRRFLIEALLDRPGARGFVAEDGFVALRPGRRATQIGPLVAACAATATALLDAALAAAPGPVLLDASEARLDLSALLEARGFRRQRPYLRMALGRERPFGDPARLLIVAGPEFG